MDGESYFEETTSELKILGISVFENKKILIKLIFDNKITQLTPQVSMCESFTYYFKKKKKSSHFINSLLLKLVSQVLNPKKESISPAYPYQIYPWNAYEISSPSVSLSFPSFGSSFPHPLPFSASCFSPLLQIDRII